MSFIIDDTCEFVHIPKTGGKWIEQVCKPWIRVADAYGRHTGRRTDLPAFAVARDPYSWMKSCVGYTQLRWVVVTKNWPAWFHDTAYRKIGAELKTLRIPGVHIDTVLTEYLRVMPGEYSRASIELYKQVDDLLKFEWLKGDLHVLLRKLKCPHEAQIAINIDMTGPVNVSKDKQTVASPELLEALRTAEQQWYEYIGRRLS